LRPLSVTLVGWLFVVTGCVVLAACLARAGESDAADVGFAALSGALALAGGVFALRGRGFARWLLVAWMAGHVVLGFLHTVERGGVHVVFLAVLVLALFNARATAFFRYRAER
jgi:hypothetical protein